jgi:hypothetical protein
VTQQDDLRELLRLLLTRNHQLQTALDTRIAIEQAKGILAERLRIPLQEAFLVLRTAARRNRLKIRDLAQRVVESPETPPEIEEALEGRPVPTDDAELRIVRQRGAIRVAENEAYFRALNEQILRDVGADTQERHGFLCECGAEDCIEAISLTREEYERVRANGDHFVILPGHELPEVERVVEQNERFHVIEKLGAAAIVAEETDPRA